MAASHAGDAMVVGEAMIVAGIGCKSGVSVTEIMTAITTALGAYGIPRSDLRALATIPAKRAEAGLHDAALLLGLPLAVPNADELARTTTASSSHASIAATGLPSASEAATLAACGDGARLLGPRTVAGNVTCAIAITGDHS